jgi:hypothetical protein
VNIRTNGRPAALAAVTAAVLVPLGVFGGPALAKSASSASQYEYSGSSQYQYKVALCHRTHSKKHPWHVINVSSSAAKAHMRHGDTLAPCPAALPVPVQKPGKEHGSDDSRDSHNQSGEHGQSGDDHGNGGGNGKGHGHGK